jgi:hypothetical protein
MHPHPSPLNHPLPQSITASELPQLQFLWVPSSNPATFYYLL